MIKMKTVLITGASNGIGRTLARNLVLDGFQVVANYNKSEESAKLMQKGYDISIFKADVSKSEEVEKIVDFTIKKYGKIDILINNAGIDSIGLFTEIKEEEWNNIINVNLSSVFLVTQKAVKDMISRKEGCIINISSVWGMVGASCEVAYSVSKAGIDAMTKSLAKELGPSNIRVNSIAPGIIDTKMNENLSKEEKQEIIKEIPLGRIGKTEDVYKCVKWLIEDNYTTGQIISPNGGWVII